MKSFWNIVNGIFGVAGSRFVIVVTSRWECGAVSLLPTITPGELAVYTNGAVATPGF
jgi:hypothetical protein